MTPPNPTPASLDRRLCIAPMLDWTTRHCRYFLRLLSRHVLLYTEMVTTGALIHGERRRFLAFHPAEHPLAIQLGGSDPAELARCARMAEEAGFDEVNLNLGCPSERVQSGRFGACLMAEPELVRDGIAAMRAAVAIPVTVKTRLGIDARDSWEELVNFVDIVADSGCRVFILHARKAWLKGLSPKENRNIPPLEYAKVQRLKHLRPELEIILNGGITTLDQALAELTRVDGVMIGREAYHNPYLLAQIDSRVYGDAHAVPSRVEIVERMLEYMQQELARGVYLAHMTRPLLGLFLGQPGARAWRRLLSEQAHRDGAGVEVVKQALRAVSDRAMEDTGA